MQPTARCWAERATFLLAEKMGKQKGGKLVEAGAGQGGRFIEALGQLEKELSDEDRAAGLFAEVR